MMLSCTGTSEKNEEEGSDENENTESEEVVLYKEVIAIHDEAMPKIQELADLRVEMIEDSLALEEEMKAKAEELMEQMESAEENMMNWMRNFNMPPDSLELSEQLEYLEEEKKKVTEINQEMDSLIEAAKNHLSPEE